jgi:Polyketide cyclase / dehydrase and lipid transport
MACVDVTVSSDLSPEQAWKLASDLHRIGDWLTIFGGWRGEVPSSLQEGTRVSSCIKVKGFRNVIHWQVTGYDPPQCLQLSGTGRGGVRIRLALTITDDHADSAFHLVADLSGALLSGPVGTLVARVLQSDVRKSVQNLAALK